MSTNYRQLRRENVARHYDRGGHMIALTDATIEIDGEPLHIPKGHRLTREQALNYGGDVQYIMLPTPALSKSMAGSVKNE